MDAVCREALNVIDDLERMWGNPRLGLALSAAYFAAAPLSSRALAKQLNLSDDTVRRALNPLVNVGRVQVTREGRDVAYAASPIWAARTRNRVTECCNNMN